MGYRHPNADSLWTQGNAASQNTAVVVLYEPCRVLKLALNSSAKMCQSFKCSIAGDESC